MAVVGAIGLAAGLAQTVFTALQTQELKEMCSMFLCEADLDKLNDTMKHVNALFLDIDAKRQGLNHTSLVWIEKLKDAVYDVDDLIDKCRTIGELRRQSKDAKLGKKVGDFFSHKNKFFVNFNVSKEIKMLRERLDAITKDHTDFGLKDVFDNKPFVREETSSVLDLDIIGREHEKQAIVSMLLSDNNPSERNFSFVNIVGVAGLGKTALAKLVYEDDTVKQTFSKRIWVCVSEVSEEFNLEQILSKILQKQAFNLEQAQGKVREQLQGKRYLLVLDDVWIEKPEEWDRLKPYLVSDVRGSKVIVTSRSQKVATSIRDDFVMYHLQGLSDENSWRLFKLMVFGKQIEEHQVDSNLVDIGKEIVKKCANVPLSIRVVASLLHNQDKNIWLSFRENALGEISGRGNAKSIMSTLMFSYYQLTPELKSCFSFCSLFPKDYTINKEFLINLWSAQGYLVAANCNAQSIEDVGELYITILLNRCFFQDVELNDHDEVYSFKMHDLMHDLALEVAGNESLFMTPTIINSFCKKIRHLSKERGSSNLCFSNTLRTYIWLGDDSPWSGYVEDSSFDKVTQIVSKCKRLRVLRLPLFCIGRTFPNEVGRLLHLRYLDLTNNSLEMLPKSITKLHNLQTLKLRGSEDLKRLPNDIGKLVNLRTLDISNCENLKELSEGISKLVNLRKLDISSCKNFKELPNGFSKMVNLRTLDISDCNKLTYMPRGMDNLTNLERLSDFIVGGVDVKQREGSKLEELQAPLRSLKGNLCIRILNFSSHNMLRATNRGFVLKNARLKNLRIECGSSNDNENEFDQSEVHETMVEDLCPNENVYKITIKGYKGMEMPRWAALLREYSDMNGVKHVSSLSRFGCLKRLVLYDLENVEYIMEIENDGAWVSRTSFFPVLERLELRRMPKLKGWWRGLRWRDMEGVAGGCLVDDNGHDDFHTEHAVSVPYFLQLRVLLISDCKSMTYFPPCPHVKVIDLEGVNEALTNCMKGGASSSSNMPTSSWCLQKLRTDNTRVMMNRLLLSEYTEGGVIHITLMGDDKLKSMGTLREGFERVGSTLKQLSIDYCDELDIEEEEDEGMPWKYLQSLSSLKLGWLPKMVKLPNGFRHLTSLQSLKIVNCCNMEEVGECIGSLTSLQSLLLSHCHKLKELPECIGFLKNLQSLHINSKQLESIPESMRHLTSLTTLQIYGASYEFRKKLRKPNGKYWPRISHITNLAISKFIW